MKIVTFWGGLGNQIFEYAYLQYLRKQYPNETFYSFLPKVGFKRHNGFELTKWFVTDFPKYTLLSNIIAYTLFYINKILLRFNLSQPLTCTMLQYKPNRLFHCDWWQDKQFIEKDFCLDFQVLDLNERNRNILEDIIKKENSVAIHIRRGDYLNTKNKRIYGDICTDDYYKNAMKWIIENVNNPHFIFFSDDTEYVKQKYLLDKMTIVDWNKDNDSIIDMYLMTQCKYMVLANSTFSYWAARFNKGVKQVICPERWNNQDKPDITMETWITMNS